MEYNAEINGYWSQVLNDLIIFDLNVVINP